MVVPSLVNRAYVLDLLPGRSFLEALAAAGLRPFLLDWDAPGADERRFDLDAYIARSERALAAVRARAGAPVGLIGYCMGGLFTVAMAQRQPDAVGAHAMLAAPWDFAAYDRGWLALLELALPALNAIGEALGALPVDILQALFASLDPFLADRKFRRFAALDPAGTEARLFVALEDWLNDGVPLAERVARETFEGWFLANAPGRGAWRVAGRPVRPQEVAAPTLVVVPEQDYIVPPASAAAVVPLLARGQRLGVAAGHIGMVAGGRAERVLYRPVMEWLRTTLRDGVALSSRKRRP
ncbi:MAG: alpha/beta hydrolase [Alphaproteobacteria bacterium]|nr:alpha/beta hydrolase [Alphaproteobacteria bacterium]